MKKVRLFATVSVLCLGLAAVATTQAHSKTTVSGFQDDGNGHCTVEITNACQNVNGTDCVDGAGAPLYRRNTGACSQQFKKI